MSERAKQPEQRENRSSRRSRSQSGQPQAKKREQEGGGRREPKPRSSGRRSVRPKSQAGNPEGVQAPEKRAEPAQTRTRERLTPEQKERNRSRNRKRELERMDPSLMNLEDLQQLNQLIEKEIKLEIEEIKATSID